MARCAVALALTCAAGCGEQSQPQGGSDVGDLYQALGVQLQNCASNALDCLGAANCDDAAEQACKDGYRQCRADTRAAYRAYREAVHACWETKWQCVRDAGWGDAGAEARSACKEQLRACIAEDRPIRAPAGPCMMALRECVHADSMEGERPSREQVRDCLGAAHQCVLDRLPDCEPEDMPDAATSSDAGN
jgi:hypothetical protein